MSINARKRRDGRVEVTVWDGGERLRRLAPKDMGTREARRIVGEALLEEVRRARTLSGPPQTLWRFCSEVYKNQHGLDPDTYKHERKYKVARIMQDLGQYRIEEVTTAIVKAWLRDLERGGGRGGKPLGPATLADYQTALRAIYRVALEHDEIREVPFHLRAPTIVLEADVEPWTLEMKERLVKTADTDDPEMAPLARFLIFVGCRRVEAMRLRCVDVRDIPRPQFRLYGKRRARWLPLDDQNGKLTALGLLMASLPRDGEYVFLARRHKRTWPQKRWERLCKAAGVPSKTQDLRDTFITERLVANVPPIKVAHWCGNSVRVIEQRCVRWLPKHLTAVGEVQSDDVVAERLDAEPSADGTTQKETKSPT
jgi:integrase